MYNCFKCLICNRFIKCWCHGLLAWSRILRERETYWWGILSRMEQCELLGEIVCSTNSALILMTWHCNTFFFLFCIQLLKDATKISYGWSFYLAWTGVGFTLASAILFSGAAICLRGEREREEAVNMQYIMPGNFIVLRHVFTLENERKNIISYE